MRFSDDTTSGGVAVAFENLHNTSFWLTAASHGHSSVEVYSQHNSARLPWSRAMRFVSYLVLECAQDLPGIPQESSGLNMLICVCVPTECSVFYSLYCQLAFSQRQRAFGSEDGEFSCCITHLCGSPFSQENRRCYTTLTLVRNAGSDDSTQHTTTETYPHNL